METSGVPTPATTLPSDRSETPKSLKPPLTSASTSPALPHHWAFVPSPWVDLNQNSIEKSSAICRAIDT
jgi:hypothetical protein